LVACSTRPAPVGRPISSSSSPDSQVRSRTDALVPVRRFRRPHHSCREPERVLFLLKPGMLQNQTLAHVLIGEPGATSDQARGQVLAGACVRNADVLVLRSEDAEGRYRAYHLSLSSSSGRDADTLNAVSGAPRRRDFLLSGGVICQCAGLPMLTTPTLAVLY
jgi:hypothetical protein